MQPDEDSLEKCNTSNGTISLKPQMFDEVTAEPVTNNPSDFAVMDDGDREQVQIHIKNEKVEKVKSDPFISKLRKELLGRDRHV